MSDNEEMALVIEKPDNTPEPSTLPSEQRAKNLAVGNSTSQMVEMLSELAKNPDVDVQKMSAILDLQERMMDKEAEQAFNVALHELQTEMPVIKKDNSVQYPVDKNKPDGAMKKAFDYATFENIMLTVKPLLVSHGFSVTFDSEQREGGGAIIRGTLSHVGGHAKTASFAAALDNSGGKNNIQGMGSTFSYGKRYCLTSLLNIVTEGEDDDGNTEITSNIDEHQVKTINDLLDETNSDKAAFCARYKITAVPELPQKKYTQVMQDIKAKQKILARQAEKGGES